MGKNKTTESLSDLVGQIKQQRNTPKQREVKKMIKPIKDEILFNFHIDKELLDQLKFLKIKKDRSIKELITEAIIEYWKIK